MIDRIAAWFQANRRAALAGLFVIAAVLFGLLLAYRGGYQAKYAVPAAGDDRALRLPPPPIPTPTPRVAVAPPPPAAAPPAPAPDADADGDDEDASDRQDDQRRIAKAIDHTVRKALRRGESVHWHKAGQEGFVMVSAPRDDGDRICRNVTATMLDAHGQTLSNAHLWCAPIDDQDDGDAWAPAD
jgi:cell division protein FtsN